MITHPYRWRDADGEHELHLVPVPGTAEGPYLFQGRAPVDVRDFALGAVPVTQALWTHVMGTNPATFRGARRPIENISWHDIVGAGGFLERINASPIRAAVAGDDAALRFHLPTESEWEYAARGGPRWRDGLRFSGSDDVDAVAWYGPRWSWYHQLTVRLFGWRLGWRLANRLVPKRRTETHDVATKAPNQLGLHDMSGNVWEWCEDVCVDLDAVPSDGTAARGAGDERRLRGGCHHNWDLHCTVAWRYGIVPEAHDGCLGFRLALR